MYAYYYSYEWLNVIYNYFLFIGKKNLLKIFNLIVPN